MQKILKLFLLILIITACSNNNSSNEITFKKEAVVQIINSDGEELNFDVELADEPHKQAQGLMFRYKLEPNQGMFFIFKNNEQQSFWMKNTYLSLDIIFIDENFTIVQIHENAFPLSEEPILSDYPAKYVLEVLGGTAKQQSINVGYKVNYTVTRN